MTRLLGDATINELDGLWTTRSASSCTCAFIERASPCLVDCIARTAATGAAGDGHVRAA